MARTPRGKGPAFVRYFAPVLDALRASGSSARPKEVCEWILENVDVPDDEVESLNKGGQSKFENRVAWARFYLAKAGLISAEQHGVWVLSARGKETFLDHPASVHLFREVQKEFRREREEGGSLAADDGEEIDEDTGEKTAPTEQSFLEEEEVRERLIEILRGISDVGFEEFSARLLRHMGFVNVTITSRSNDHGVDGEGFLLINPFFKTKVLFQSKRYLHTVGPDKIRDFRGALQGRAERGIFLTTGTFTRGAIEEANRWNAIP